MSQKTFSGIFFCFIVVLIFTSCKKDSGAGPAPGGAKVKTYTEEIKSGTLGNSLTTYNLSYDGNDRISSIVSASDPGDKFVYTYKTANNYSLDIFSSNILEIHVEFFLNSQSLPDSTFQYSGVDSSTEKYIYNARNELIKLYEYDYSAVTGADLWNITDYTYDASSNVITEEDIYGDGSTYEYYPDLVYIYPPIGPAPPPVKRNLVKKRTLTSGGFPIGNAVFTYTFDSNDRISTDKAMISDGTIVLKSYTYY